MGTTTLTVLEVDCLTMLRFPSLHNCGMRCTGIIPKVQAILDLFHRGTGLRCKGAKFERGIGLKISFEKSLCYKLYLHL